METEKSTPLKSWSRKHPNSKERAHLKTAEIIHARGHVNVTSLNRTTFEITKEAHLTKRGDCIVAVDSDKGASGLSSDFRKAMQNKEARIRIQIEVDGEAEVVNACGSPLLSFTHPTDLVVRKSDYTCGRTLAIRADKAAKDFPRSLIEKLQNPHQKVKITLTVKKAT